MDGVRTGEGGGYGSYRGDGLGSIGVDGRSRTLFSRRTGPLWPPAKESTSGGKGWPKRWVSVGYVTILWWRPCPRFSIRRHFYSTPRQGYREAKLPSGYSVRCCSRFSIRGEPDAD